MVGRVPVHSKYPIGGGGVRCCNARARAGEGRIEGLAKDVSRKGERAHGLRIWSGGVSPTQGRTQKLGLELQSSSPS